LSFPLGLAVEDHSAFIQQSPQLTQLYQLSEPFRELADTRQQYLQQQLDQEQNKLIGRLGVAPVQGASPSAMPAMPAQADGLMPAA